MLDQELPRLLPPGGPFASANDLRPGYEEIGLTRAGFESGTLVYSGATNERVADRGGRVGVPGNVPRSV